MSTRTLKHKAIHGVAWYGGSRIVVQAFSWAMTILVARVLTPSDYGLFGMAVLYVGLVDFLNELGFGAAIVQKKDIEEADLHTLFWFGLGTSVVLYALTVAVAPVVAQFFHQPRLTKLLAVLGLGFIITALRTVPWNVLTREVDFKTRSIAEMFGNLFSSLLTVILAYAGLGVWALAVGILSRDLWMTAQVYLQMRWIPRWQFSSERLSRVMSFSLNVVAARFVWYAYDSSDKLIVGKLLNDRALGFYTMAVRFTMELSGRLLTIINQVAFPIYSRLQEDPRRLKGYFLRASQLVSSVTFPAFAGIFLVADVAVPALLTDKWLPIVQPLKILCFVTMTTSVGALIGPAVLARDRADLAVKYNLLCLCVMPAGFCFGTRWGVAGVCGAWALLYPFLVMFWYGLTRKLIGYEWHELVRAYKPATVSTIAMLALTFGVRWLTHPLEANLVKLTAIIGAGAASYIAVFALGFREQLTEVRELFSRSQPAARVT